jgi:hypothetical protein
VPPFRREKISCLRPQLLPSRGAGQRESPGRKRSAAGERTGRETGGAGEQADSLERRRLTAAALAKEGAEEVHTARWQLRGRGEGRGQPARTRDGARKVPSSQRRPAPRRSPPAVSSRSKRRLPQCRPAPSAEAQGCTRTAAKQGKRRRTLHGGQGSGVPLAMCDSPAPEQCSAWLALEGHVPSCASVGSGGPAVGNDSAAPWLRRNPVEPCSNGGCRHCR